MGFCALYSGSKRASGDSVRVRSREQPVHESPLSTHRNANTHVSRIILVNSWAYIRTFPVLHPAVLRDSNKHYSVIDVEDTSINLLGTDT